MIVDFKMKINDDTIEFKSIGKLNENLLSFKDMNNKENTINIYLLEEQIIIEQKGFTNMKNNYIQGQKTDGFYNTQHNIEAITHCYTKVMKIENKSIYIEYDFFFNDEYASTNILLIKY